MTPPRLTRRSVLGGAAAVGGAALLAACGSDDSTDAADSDATDDADSGAGEGDASGEALVSVEEVPVGGGVIISDQQVVVTQPTEGEFNAFSSTCTHQGCQVSRVEETIGCACHGSEFSVETGEVERGPATQPLPAVEITESEGQLFLA